MKLVLEQFFLQTMLCYFLIFCLLRIMEMRILGPWSSIF